MVAGLAMLVRVMKVVVAVMIMTCIITIRWHWRDRTHAWPLIEEIIAQVLEFMPLTAAGSGGAAAAEDHQHVYFMTDANMTESGELTRGLRVMCDV